MDTRTRLLEVTAEIYAEAAYRGTTTRRVAEAAGVNEVTIFRLFGSKDVLIKAALERSNQPGFTPLPAVPVDPSAELYAFVRQVFDHLYRHRFLISRVMGDMVEHPEIAPSVCDEPNNEHCQIAGYLTRMRDRGLTRKEFMPEAAAGLLFGAVLTHALWRDQIPDLPPADLVLRQFVDLALTAVGAEVTAPAARAS